MWETFAPSATATMESVSTAWFQLLSSTASMGTALSLQLWVELAPLLVWAPLYHCRVSTAQFQWEPCNLSCFIKTVDVVLFVVSCPLDPLLQFLFFVCVLPLRSVLDGPQPGGPYGLCVWPCHQILTTHFTGFHVDLKQCLCCMA